MNEWMNEWMNVSFLYSVFSTDECSVHLYAGYKIWWHNVNSGFQQCMSDSIAVDLILPWIEYQVQDAALANSANIALKRHLQDS